MIRNLVILALLTFIIFDASNKIERYAFEQSINYRGYIKCQDGRISIGNIDFDADIKAPNKGSIITLDEEASCK